MSKLMGDVAEQAMHNFPGSSVVMPVEAVRAELTPDERRQAELLAQEMAWVLHLDEDDFVTVAHIPDATTGEAQVTVAYAAPQGVHLGSWERIYDPRNDTVDFMVELEDGRQIDMRRGMTLAVYGALLDFDAKNTGYPSQIDKGEPKKLTGTLLTGENATQHVAPVALNETESGRGIVRVSVSPSADGYGLRPAIAIRSPKQATPFVPPTREDIIKAHF